MKIPSSGWTPERVQQLRDLAARGFSASQIAAEMGYVTRNAVIGKAQRLKVQIGVPSQPARRQVAPPAAPKPRKPKPPAPAKPAPPPAPAIEEIFPDPAVAQEAQSAPLMLTLAELPIFGACRWPFGDPRSSSFRYCGSPCGGQVYCEQHRSAAFTPRALVQKRAI